MVTIQQFQNGVLKYIETDILPHVSGIKKIGLGVYITLAAKNATELIENYKDHPVIRVMGVIKEDGSVDVDALYNAAIPAFSNGQKTLVSVPMIGDFTVDQSDLEKIYKYIKEA